MFVTLSAKQRGIDDLSLGPKLDDECIRVAKTLKLRPTTPDRKIARARSANHIGVTKNIDCNAPGDIYARAAQDGAINDRLSVWINFCDENIGRHAVGFTPGY